MQRRGVVSLQLDQHDSLAIGAEARSRQCVRTKEIEKGSIQQFQRGWVALVQGADHVPQMVERRQVNPEPGSEGGHVVQPPLDLGDEAERALRPDNQIQDVARSEVGIDGVA
jgi:hypothetical protein